MISFTKVIAAGALAVSMSAGVAGAVTVTLLDSSAQGVTNNVGIDYAVGYGAHTRNGASWSVDPTWTPPSGNVSGQAQSPFNSNSLTDTQNYFAVGGVAPQGGAMGPVTLSFSLAQDSFDILWGSIDSYNIIEFLSGGAVVFTYNGTNVMDEHHLAGVGPNYEAVALLNFSGFDNGFDSVRFTSGQSAFEFALAPVPVPAAGLLLIGALSGLAALRRRKKA